MSLLEPSVLSSSLYMFVIFTERRGCVVGRSREPFDWSSANNKGGDRAVLCRITCQSNAKLLPSRTTCAIVISHRPFFEEKKKYRMTAA